MRAYSCHKNINVYDHNIHKHRHTYAKTHTHLIPMYKYWELLNFIVKVFTVYYLHL